MPSAHNQCSSCPFAESIFAKLDQLGAKIENLSILLKSHIASETACRERCEQNALDINGNGKTGLRDRVLRTEHVLTTIEERQAQAENRQQNQSKGYWVKVGLLIAAVQLISSIAVAYLK